MSGRTRKGTLINYWWECKLVQPLWKTVWKSLKKLSTELTYYPAIPILVIQPKNMKTVTEKDMDSYAHHDIIYKSQNTGSTQMFINRRMDKEYVGHTCMCMHGWTHVTRTCARTHSHTHRTITQPRKRMKFCHLQQHGWALESIMLSEKSQTEKDKTLEYDKTNRPPDKENKLVVSTEERKGEGQDRNRGLRGSDTNHYE